MTHYYRPPPPERPERPQPKRKNLKSNVRAFRGKESGKITWIEDDRIIMVTQSEKSHAARKWS